ncbi:tRNA lysidine(34) synthetase TilS [Spirabiliibacterium falconis]|uniref:tRNA lysidine(34) synthetase TilS n=1 Tax=Spirabiliibacterium falconis TaxID=572023 RepID=UPI001AAD1576|nr:tRNA lysidine(34) synthetase TilS [Spirabiliibacterium falconis]MBE2893645.1 tRNA lysidine(34) synthetase TilS [Spirabiliibacterium falconis]
MGLFTHFIRTLEHYAPQQRHFLLAFSGGLDSTALLLLFTHLKKHQPDISLRAVHIHHGLSQYADQWARHCQQLCEQIGVEFIIKKVHIPPQNLEANARQARYRTLHSLCQSNEWLVSAHHLQDQSETFLLALKRGSGIQGLSAMPMVKKRAGIIHFRPLLNVNRDELIDFVKAQHITWIDDESNDNQRFDRNFLRHSILPPLRNRWTQIDMMIAQSAAQCAEQHALLTELLQPHFTPRFNAQNGSFDIAQFDTLSKPLQQALLRHWLAQLACPMPSQFKLNTLITHVIFAKHDAMPQLTLGNHVIRRFQQRLYLTPSFAPTRHWQGNLTFDTPLVLPDNLGSLTLRQHGNKVEIIWDDRTFILPICPQPLTVKFAYSGKVRLTPTACNTDIKKIWQTLAIPPWQRSRIPLIFSDDNLVAALGTFIVEHEKIRQ